MPFRRSSTRRTGKHLSLHSSAPRRTRGGALSGPFAPRPASANWRVRRATTVSARRQRPSGKTRVPFCTLVTASARQTAATRSGMAVRPAVSTRAEEASTTISRSTPATTRRGTERGSHQLPGKSGGRPHSTGAASSSGRRPAFAAGPSGHSPASWPTCGNGTSTQLATRRTPSQLGPGSSCDAGPKRRTPAATTTASPRPLCWTP
mmetsp:Transcript_3392/g.9894  ORF Transcript_3392/g.9894 Transcript_3392/m.9894 type:complete len:206 (+) Transcript_3392:403-1020(+)